MTIDQVDRQLIEILVKDDAQVVAGWHLKLTPTVPFSSLLFVFLLSSLLLVHRENISSSSFLKLNDVVL